MLRVIIMFIYAIYEVAGKCVLDRIDSTSNNEIMHIIKNILATS